MAEVWHLAWPHFVGNASVILAFAVGVAIAGHSGVEHLAGIGAVYAIMVPVNTAMMVLLSASTATIAEAVGRKDGQRIRQQAWQLSWLAFGIFALMGVACFVFPFALAALGTSQAVLSIAVPYMILSVLCMAPLALLMIMDAVMSGHKQVKPVMRAEVAVAICTVLLAALLCYPAGPFRLGAVGLAIAVLTTHTVAAAWLVFQADRFCREYSGTSLFRIDLPNRIAILSILGLGGPLALSVLIRLAAQSVLVGLAVKAGVLHIASFQVSNSLLQTLVLPMASVASVITILLGQAVVTRPKDMLKSLRSIAYVMFAVCAVLVSATWLFAEPLAGLFTSNTRVIEIASQAVRILSILLVVRAVILVSDGCLTVAKQTAFTPIASLIGNWGVAVPLALILAAQGRATAPLLVAALTAGSLVIAVIQMIRALRWLRTRSLQSPVFD